MYQYTNIPISNLGSIAPGELPEAPEINVPFVPPGYEGGWIDPLGTGVVLTQGTSANRAPTTLENIQRWLGQNQMFVFGVVGILVILAMTSDGGRRGRY